MLVSGSVMEDILHMRNRQLHLVCYHNIYEGTAGGWGDRSLSLDHEESS